METFQNVPFHLYHASKIVKLAFLGTLMTYNQNLECFIIFYHELNMVFCEHLCNFLSLLIVYLCIFCGVTGPQVRTALADWATQYKYILINK